MSWDSSWEKFSKRAKWRPILRLLSPFDLSLLLVKIAREKGREFSIGLPQNWLKKAENKFLKRTAILLGCSQMTSYFQVKRRRQRRNEGENRGRIDIFRRKWFENYIVRQKMILFFRRSFGDLNWIGIWHVLFLFLRLPFSTPFSFKKNRILRLRSESANERKKNATN